jgi:hypothetical protein
MSGLDRPPMPPIPPPAQRSGCMTAFMVLAGIVLLLPGLCALLFGGGTLLSEGRVDPGIVSFVVLGLLVGALGVVLIVAAIRGRRP